MSKQRPVIIVGGGIGGMALALALAKHQIASVVLEAASEFRVYGSGLQFCPNTFKMVDYLGLLQRFSDVSIFPEHLCYVDGLTGFKFFDLPLGSPFVERFGYPFGSFRRNDVIQVFFEECQKSPFIQLVTSAKIQQVFEEGDRAVAVSKTGEQYEGRLLVGCDGLWSVVRPYIEENARLRISGQIIYRGVIHADEMPRGLPMENIVHYVRPNAHIVHYPIGRKGLYNISAIFQSDRVPDPHESMGNKEELMGWFEGSIPRVMELLERIDTSYMWSLNDRDPIANWTKGRITILGDAAHPTLPYLTSGAGMAIEDAVVLAAELSKHGEDYVAAFKEYQQKRYLRTAYVQLYSRAYGDIHHSKGVVRELRNALIPQRSVEQNLQWVSYLYKGIDVTA